MADSVKPLKGMFKDTSPVDQPNGTYRDALNAIIDVKRGAISNEYGAKAHGSFLSSYLSFEFYTKPIGCITLPDDNLIVFTASETTHLLGPLYPTSIYPFRLSSIFHVNTKYDETEGPAITELLTTADVDTYTGLPFSTGDLNFKLTHPITGEARISANADIIVYFTDDYSKIITDTQTKIEYVEEYNPPRVFNVTRQYTYLNPSIAVTLPAFNNLYSNPAKNITFLNVFPDTGRIAEVIGASITEGGGVDTGVYHVALAYADIDFTETDVFLVSLPVSIVPLAESTIPRETITGAANQTQTGKSIKWRVVNLSVNFDYTYIIPYVIQRMGDAIFTKKLEPVKLKQTDTHTIITYSGLEGAAQSSLDEVIIDTAKYLTAKTLTQLDSRLYMGNLKNRRDLGYQRFANSITIDAVVKTIENFDPRLYDIYNLNKGYSQMIYPDVLNPSLTANGQATPFLSLPTELIYTVKGDIKSYIENVIRPIQEGTSKGYRDATLNTKRRGYRRGEVYAFYISFVFKDGSESYAYHIPGRKPKDISKSGDGSLFENQGIEDLGSLYDDFNSGEIKASQPNAKIYQFIDTSYLGTNPTSMGFWENENELYPAEDPDFSVWTVQPAGTPLLNSSTTLNGQKVRHHKMPSNHNYNYSYVVYDEDFSTPNLSSSSDNTGKVVFNETARILGIKLSNIQIPKFMLKQVQGYKVYYAKRNQYDKTIIGQGGWHPATPYLAANIATTREDASRGPYYSVWHMNGNLHRTGLIHETALWTEKAYLTQSVGKFHDFNLLRKKHTLATATHVDIQAIMTMQPWSGGFKGMQLGKVPDAVTSGVDSYMYTSMRSGHGDSEFIWIHPNLGNTVDRNISEGDVGYDVWGPRVLWGNVYVAARWRFAGTPGTDIGYTGLFAYVDGTEPDNKFERNQEDVLTQLQTIFMVAPDSASYLNGLGILRNQSATAYQGATFLNNTSGESAIALGLISGLPALHGSDKSLWNYYDYLELVLDQESQISMPSEDPENKRAQNMSLGREFVKKFDGTGRPNVYLLNLCSYKTDVFEPYESQQLVWTGHYQSLSEVDVETGIGPLNEDDGTRPTTANYYTGASSPDIFGGDTFISRYGYRTTNQDSQLIYFRIGEATVSGRNVWGDIPLNMSTGFTSGERVLWNIGNAQQRYFEVVGDISFINYNWVTPNHDVMTTIYQFFVESDDNLNFRYTGDVEKGISPATSVYFDRNVAAEVLYKSPLYDLSKMDNLLYEDQYSAVQNLKVATPFPKAEKSAIRFPGRVIRSNILQGSNFDDTYRYFLALDFKDFPVNRGEITKVFNLNALLHVHTTRSIFRTKGKQVVQMTDASQAYIGSGDLFAQEPEEFIQSVDGYLGMSGVTSGLVIKDGYAFVNRKSRNIFMIGNQGLVNITDKGMSLWARENVPYVMENYGYVFDDIIRPSSPDSPTYRFGFTIGYDPLFRRLIVTKKELIPTNLFINDWNSGRITVGASNIYVYRTVLPGGIVRETVIDFNDTTYFKEGGWTLSYSLDQEVWASRHSYIPSVYGFTSKYMYSMPGLMINSVSQADSKIFEHSDMENPCTFYDLNSINGAGIFPVTYNFEIDVIFTGQESERGSARYSNKVCGSVNYMLDAYVKKHDADPTKQQFNPGFTSYYVYNTTQISGENALVNLNSIRKVEGHWSFNNFRDLSSIEFNTSLQQVDGNGLPYTDVQGNPYLGSYTTSSSSPMFTSEGVINGGYINSNKPWYEQRKFIDKFLGVRLISNNSLKNLLSLYIVSAPSRISPR